MGCRGSVLIMGVVQSNRRGSRSPRATGVAEVEPDAVPDGTEPTFDPSEHTVTEVLAYVDEHPDEAAAILAAEQAGKARKGITDALS